MSAAPGRSQASSHRSPPGEGSPVPFRPTAPLAALSRPMQNAPPPGVRTLHPGDVACAERGETMETLLGSCVAVILTDPRRTVGAMCHIVHSKPPVSASTRSTAYGDMALMAMEELLLERGITPRLCHAYVYGGGNMFPSLVTQSHVGDANVQWTLNALHERGIRVLEHELGGRVYRRLRWTVGAHAPEVTSMPV
jgi:chemotaxis protein CheD